MAVEIPHFAMPFRLERGRVAVVEQDSAEDIAMCVEAAGRCTIGDRLEAPTFGIPNFVHQNGEIDVDELRAAIVESEPRARAIVDRIEDPADLRIQTIRTLLEGEVDG